MENAKPIVPPLIYDVARANQIWHWLCAPEQNQPPADMQVPEMTAVYYRNISILKSFGQVLERLGRNSMPPSSRPDISRLWP